MGAAGQQRPSGGVRFAEELQRPAVCVCIDQSVASREAAQWATSFLRPGETIRLLTVVAPSPGTQLLYTMAQALPVGVACEPDPAEVRRAQALLEERMEDVVEMGVDPSSVSVATATSCLGSATDIARTLLAEAERCGCSTLVVGSRGLGVPERAVLGLLGLGSVSEELVKTARTECVAVHRPSATGDADTVRPTVMDEAEPRSGQQ